jgi:ribosomal protein S17
MTGEVVSNKMEKAVVVMTYTVKLNTKYNKRYKTRKKYTAACSDASKFTVGQAVEIVSCRPVSKTISHKVVE